MTIVYRNAGAWGAGKGSQLTPAEADGNFHDIDSRVDNLESNPKIGKVITSVSQPNQYTGRFTLSDATTVDIELPVEHWSWRGEAQQGATYYKGDVVYWPQPEGISRQFSYGHRGLWLVTQDITLPNNAFWDDQFFLAEPIFLYDMWQTPSARSLTTYGYGTYIANFGEHAPFYGGIYTVYIGEGVFGYYPWEDQHGYYFRCYGREPTAFQSRTWTKIVLYGFTFATGTRLYIKNDMDLSASVSGMTPGEQLRVGPNITFGTPIEFDTPLGRFNGGVNNGNYIWTNDYGALITAVAVAPALWELSIQNGTFGGIVNA